jgi:hypothetical protein
MTAPILLVVQKVGIRHPSNTMLQELEYNGRLTCPVHAFYPARGRLISVFVKAARSALP